jgi:hypothetical protein
MFGEWQPGETVAGNLELLADYPPLPFQLSSWIADRISDLVPKVIMMRDAETPPSVVPLVGQTLNMIESNDARQVWHLRGRVKDTLLVFDAYVYLYSGADVARIEFSFTNSDPSTSEIDQPFEWIGITTGEFFSMDYRDHFNVIWPWHNVPPVSDWHHLTIYQKNVADAQQLLFSGWLLCLPTPPMPGFDIFDPITRLRMDSLHAYVTDKRQNMIGGPVWGMGDFSEPGKWLAFGVLPQIPAQSAGSLARFQAHIAGVVDPYDQKYKNLAKSAGQTGAQEDFGASKGGACVNFQEPLLIEELRYMVNEYYRPFHNRQPDGSPITKESNPQLWTWSQLPIGTTEPPPPGDLGKWFGASGIWPPWRQGTGYTGEDDQHRSQNTFNAAYALTGSHALESILHDFYQIDRTQVPNRIGAPRAIGRLYMAWANMLRLLPSVQRPVLQDHMWTRMGVIEKDWIGGNVPEDRPIRVLTLGSDPDLTNPDGSRKTAWIVWEHAIATMGFYAAHLQTDGIHSDAYKRSAAHFARLVCEYGTFYDGIAWRSLREGRRRHSPRRASNSNHRSSLRRTSSELAGF